MKKLLLIIFLCSFIISCSDDSDYTNKYCWEFIPIESPTTPGDTIEVAVLRLCDKTEMEAIDFVNKANKDAIEAYEQGLVDFVNFISYRKAED